jgi:hypothetical protein
MTSANATASTNLHKAKAEGSDWGEKLARAGYYAKGALYITIGFLAAKAAFGTGGDVGGSKNALQVLAGEGTLGIILLWIIAIGLVGYAAWNAWRAIVDPENEGDDKEGLGKRAFFAVSAILHAVLAVWVFTTLLGSGGSGSSGGSGGTQGLVGSVLSWGVIGQILVGIAALVIIGFAIQQLIKAWKVDLSDQLMFSKMSDTMKKVTTYSGRGGLAARGIVFTIVGLFILTAAWQGDSSEAGGLGAALGKLGSFGPIVLGVVAIGLALYGVHMIMKGRYRRIEIE